MMDIIYWFTYSKLGLIFNTIGSIVLVVGSNKTTNLLTKFVDTIKSTYGTYGQGSAVPEVQNLSIEFEEAKKSAVTINTIGYILFAIGFILQLL